MDFLNAKPDLMPAKVAKQKGSALVALSKTGIGTSTEFLSGATQAVYHSVKGSGQHHCVGSVYAYVVDPMASLLMLASDPSDPLDLSGNKHHGDTSVSQAAVEAEVRSSIIFFCLSFTHSHSLSLFLFCVLSCAVFSLFLSFSLLFLQYVFSFL